MVHDTDDGATLKHDAEIVEQVLALHQLYEPIGAISKATGLDDSITRFVIQNLRLPRKPLTEENGVSR